LLVSGDVEAAVVSSAVPLGRMSGRGLIPLLFFGDVLRLPTTGLAVSRDLYAQEPELVRAMCECCRESLRLLRTDAALARKAVAAAFGLNSSEADETVALLRRCYTTDGRCDAQVQNFAIESVRRVLGSAAQPVGEPYDFSLLAHSRGVSADHE
jgi:ABC-type nitrate/sulfonate/bicarbonate transport system substrate-binding protein